MNISNLIFNNSDLVQLISNYLDVTSLNNFANTCTQNAYLKIFNLTPSHSLLYRHVPHLFGGRIKKSKLMLKTPKQYNLYNRPLFNSYSDWIQRFYDDIITTSEDINYERINNIIKHTPSHLNCINDINFKYMQNIYSIDMSNFSDVQFDVMQYLGNTSILNLSFTNITDNHLILLPKNNNIKELILSGTSITESGLKHFMEKNVITTKLILKYCEFIKSINIFDNKNNINELDIESYSGFINPTPLCRIPSLKILNLSRGGHVYGQLYDLYIGSIVQNSEYKTKNFTNEDLIMFNSSNVKHLSISCTHITSLNGLQNCITVTIKHGNNISNFSALYKSNINKITICDTRFENNQYGFNQIKHVKFENTNFTLDQFETKTIDEFETLTEFETKKCTTETLELCGYFLRSNIDTVDFSRLNKSIKKLILSNLSHNNIIGFGKIYHVITDSACLPLDEFKKETSTTEILELNCINSINSINLKLFEKNTHLKILKINGTSYNRTNENGLNIWKLSD
jgi:hypothetical protein